MRDYAGKKDIPVEISYMQFAEAKEIGAMATTLKGKIDAILITGGMANFNYLINLIKERVKFLAPIYVYPGEDEMLALVLGAIRVLQGEEPVKKYK